LEQFGPVLPVLRHTDIDDAVARVNDTPFGRGGSVWSQDCEQAFRVATQIDAGMVWENKHHAPCNPELRCLHGKSEDKAVGA